MDYKYIEQLVDRYFDGETTREEEQILRSFFSQENVPAELGLYQDLFRYEKKAGEVLLGDDFDTKILATIEQPVVKARHLSFSTYLQPFYRAAAIVAIVLTVGNAAQRSFDQEAGEIGEDNYSKVYTEQSETHQQVTSATSISTEGLPQQPDTLRVKSEE